MIPDDLIGLPEAARLLGISRQSVLRWIQAGKLTGWRVMHRWRVSRADTLALVQRFGPGEANDRKIEQRTLPLSKNELADREKDIDAELRRMGIRR